MRDIILRTTQLTKHYKSFSALENVSMTASQGDIYGLVGKNGAGKTTFMKLITGLTEPTAGEYEIFGKTGFAANAERNRIGCLIEEPAFFGNLTAKQNLRYYCELKGITDRGQIGRVLELVHLTDAADRKFKAFSLGMKQRLGIAFALLDRPDLVVLDEPINGLDPIAISEMRDTLRKLNRELGITMIISSHILTELYAIANKFLFIDNGKVLREVTKEELDKECSRCIILKTDDTRQAAAVLESKTGISEYAVIDSTEIRIYETKVKSCDINRQLVLQDVTVHAIYESGASLEDYFKQLVGEGTK